MSVSAAEVSALHCSPGGGALVLVTGATGFIASHACRLLLALGYRVRGTVRSLHDQAKNAHLLALAGQHAPMQLVEADLTADKGWNEAVAGCEYVLHTASPFWRDPKLGDDFFLPAAVEGTKRVLAACAAANSNASSSGARVKRVVVTSSIASVCFGRSLDEAKAHGPFSEKDWTNTTTASPYQKSKTEAERAAWSFVESLPAAQKFELVTILPSAVVGPLMSANRCESQSWPENALKKTSPTVSFIALSFVDVVDVALAHIKAIQVAEAAGQRFIVSAEDVNWQVVHGWLLEEFAPKGYDMATTMLPSDGGPFAFQRVFDISKSKAVLGLHYRSIRDSVIAMAYSLIDKGFVPKKF